MINMQLQYVQLLANLKNNKSDVQHSTPLDLTMAGISLHDPKWLQGIMPKTVRGGQPFIFSFMGKNGMENALFTDDPEVALKWGGDMLTPNKRNSISNYFRKGIRCPLARLYVHKGEPQVSCPRVSIMDNGGTAHINTIGGLIQAMDYLDKLANSGFLEITYVKNNGTDRVIRTTKSDDLLRGYYSKYAASNPLDRSPRNNLSYINPREVLDRLGIPLHTGYSLSALAKGYAQFADLEVIASDDVIRVVHVNTIRKVVEIPESGIDTSIVNLNVNALINAVGFSYSATAIPDEVAKLVQTLPPEDLAVTTLPDAVSAIMKDGETDAVKGIIAYAKQHLDKISLDSCMNHKIEDNTPDFQLEF